MRHAVLLLACVALAHAHGPILSPLPFSCSAALLQMEQGAHDNLKHLDRPITRLRGGSGRVALPPQESPSKASPAEPQRVFHFGKKGTDGDKVCDSTCLL